MEKNSKRNNPICVAWVTKYALTQGIFKTEGENCVDINPDMFAYKTNGYKNSAFKNEWFLTESEAISHAEEMRGKKIASLTKQIKKMKNLKISVYF